MNLWGILEPVEFVIGWILYIFHLVFGFIGLGSGAGPSWILAIIFLTITVRLCILPLFIKQIKGIRKTQAIQPQLVAIQKKYKNKKDAASRQQMSQETQALYQKHGVNPVGSCLPMLLQLPIFFSLYNVLRSMGEIITGSRAAIGPIDSVNAANFQDSSFFGVTLSETFSSHPENIGRVVIGALIAVMIGLTFYTQRVSVYRNMPRATLEGPQAGIQKTMIYILPLTYIFMGPMLPIGVLIYWVTTNAWTLGQTLWQVRFMPTAGSPAYEEFEKRNYKKEKAAKEAEVVDETKQGQRVQPKTVARKKR